MFIVMTQDTLQNIFARNMFVHRFIWQDNLPNIYNQTYTYGEREKTANGIFPRHKCIKLQVKNINAVGSTYFDNDSSNVTTVLADIAWHKELQYKIMLCVSYACQL